MRKRLVGLTAVVIALALSMTACESSKSGQDALVGNWTWSSLVLKGVTWSPLNPSVITPGGSTVITPGLIQQFDPNSRISVTLTFNSDKTVVASANATIPGQPAVNQSASGTWSAAGDQLTINFRSGGTLNSTTLIYDASGSKLTLELTNQQFRQLLTANNVNLSSLTPAQQNMVLGLSATAEFTK